MRPRSYTITTPGKLLIAGEYAVTESAQPGIVVAVNRYITVHISESDEPILDLPQLGIENITWSLEQGSIHFSVMDKRLRFIQQAIQVVYRYFEAKQIQPIKFHLRVSSELDDTSGKKYGLGSSAAIVVAVITAILKLHQNTEVDRAIIFKLAAIAHFQTQGNGSCADIAASTYGGWLHYIAFDGNWLLEQLHRQQSIAKIVNMDWPLLMIENITLPNQLKFCVGWTGESAATAPMVTKIHQFKQQDQMAYQQFLEASKAAVSCIVRGCKENNATMMLEGIKSNRHALRTISSLANVEIETPVLAQLATIASNYGSGKSSGAGGGDCGIAFVIAEEKCEQLKQAWKKANIIALDLSPSLKGTNITRVLQ